MTWKLSDLSIISKTNSMISLLIYFRHSFLINCLLQAIALLRKGEIFHEDDIIKIAKSQELVPKVLFSNIQTESSMIEAANLAEKWSAFKDSQNYAFLGLNQSSIPDPTLVWFSQRGLEIQNNLLFKKKITGVAGYKESFKKGVFSVFATLPNLFGASQSVCLFTKDSGAKITLFKTSISSEKMYAEFEWREKGSRKVSKWKLHPSSKEQIYITCSINEHSASIFVDGHLTALSFNQNLLQAFKAPIFIAAYNELISPVNHASNFIINSFLYSQ